jgi:putative transposase
MSDLGPSVRVRLLISAWPADPPRGAVTAFCREHQISRTFFYKVAQARANGQLAAMRTKPRRPRSSPQQTDENVVGLLLATRSRLAAEGWDHGPISVLDTLRREGVTGLPSRATAARIFTAAGVVKPEPRKRPRSSFRRFVFPNPNACWQLDASQWPLASGRIVVIFQLTDDHSRLAVASLVATGETSAAALEVVQRGIQTWGVPQRLLSDNGAAINPTRRGRTSPLVELAWSLGIDTITGKPGKPTTQGKNERSHQTLQRFLRARPPATSIEQLQGLVDEFDDRFNTERGHQALPGRITPLQAWHATPKAPPPTPPTSIEPLPLPPVQRRADITGAVAVAGSRYLLGAEHANTLIHAVIQPDTIEFFDADGTHLITRHRADPGTYVGNDLPRTRRPNRPSTMS